MTKTKKQIDTYSYRKKNGKPVVVKTHERTYETTQQNTSAVKYANLDDYIIRMRTYIGAQEYEGRQTIVDTSNIDSYLEYDSKEVIEKLKTTGHATKTTVDKDGNITKYEFKIYPQGTSNVAIGMQ
jgi:hypothetical protein